MKKVFMVLLIALLAFSSTSLWAAAAAEKAPEGPVKIVYWRSLTGVAGEAQEELVARFNASQDKVIVESQCQGLTLRSCKSFLAALGCRRSARCRTA